jgi:hypothetical protein
MSAKSCFPQRRRKAENSHGNNGQLVAVNEQDIPQELQNRSDSGAAMARL